jgi:hypothetical protein
MDALFIGVFQNDSYIHQYIAFYLIAPVSITSGVSLDRLITQIEGSLAPRFFRGIAFCLVLLLLVATGLSGQRQAKALKQQFRILDYKAPEPTNLIPDLGKAIRRNFPSDTHILCNFLPDFGPQLAYYAQRDLINNLVDYRFWRTYLNRPSKHIGGVVWMGCQPAEEIVRKLPAGTKQFVKIDELSFCFWQPMASESSETDR